MLNVLGSYDVHGWRVDDDGLRYVLVYVYSLNEYHRHYPQAWGKPACMEDETNNCTFLEGEPCYWITSITERRNNV